MSSINFVNFPLLPPAGWPDVQAWICPIVTTNTLAEVLVSGAATPLLQNGPPLNNAMLAQVYTTDYKSVLLQIVVTDDSASFTPLNQALQDIVLLQLGSSGVAGTLVVEPSTASNGTFKIVATNSPGDFDATLTNAPMGQDTVLSLADPGASTGQVLVKSAAFVSGNLIVASGTAGKTADGGVAPAALQLKSNIKSLQGSWAGGGTSYAFTVTGATATSPFVANIVSTTNPAAITLVTPGTNIVTLTFDVDPGAVVVSIYGTLVAQ